MANIDITNDQVIELRTRINIINVSYDKLNKQRFACKQLEDDFQEFFKVLVESKGGDPELQYTLDLDNAQLVEFQEEATEEVTE
jgi:hypothetical protein